MKIILVMIAISLISCGRDSNHNHEIGSQFNESADRKLNELESIVIPQEESDQNEYIKKRIHDHAPSVEMKNSIDHQFFYHLESQQVFQLKLSIQSSALINIKLESQDGKTIHQTSFYLIYESPSEIVGQKPRSKDFLLHTRGTESINIFLEHGGHFHLMRPAS